MRQKLYLECSAGISGDMMVGALLDLGANEHKLRQTLKSLNLEGYSVEIGRVSKSGLDVCDFAVRLDANCENHDHDMEYLHGAAAAEYSAGGLEHGHSSGSAHRHRKEEGHKHVHEHCPEDDHAHGPDHWSEEVHGHDRGYSTAEIPVYANIHRGLPEILEILRNSAMTERAKITAARIFEILARAEAKAHGVPADQVHFHEVGAVDSIVDIAAAAICLDDLDIADVIVPVLCEGCGTIRCQHGMLPVPVPATLNIVSEYHLRLHQIDVQGEFVTPTGAAIAAAVRTEDRLPERYRVVRIGMGAGKRQYERPSILRAMLIVAEDGEADLADRILKLECNIDDCSGEALGYAMERLFAEGARDVHYTPVFMKKNRPGYLITVLCDPERREVMEEILFAETTTIGIRRQMMERSVLMRECRRMKTSYGEIAVKILKFQGTKKIAPEYESVSALARERKIPFLQMYGDMERELNGKDPEQGIRNRESGTESLGGGAGSDF